MIRMNWKGCLRRPAAIIAAFMAMAPLNATPGYSQTFDGITIIEFSDELGKQAIADGEHIVTFVSARGSYGAVVGRPGTHAGCRSLAVPDSYTGTSITFGMTVDPARTVSAQTAHVSTRSARVRVILAGSAASRRPARAALGLPAGRA